MKKSTPMQQMAMLRSSAVDFTLLTFVPVECTLIVSTFCSLIVFSSKPQKWHQPVGAPAPQKLITKYHSDFVARRGRGCHLLTFTFSRIGFLAGNPDDQSTQWFWHFLNLSPPQFDDWCISGRMSAAQLQPLWFYFPLWQTDRPDLGQSTSTPNLTPACRPGVPRWRGGGGQQCFTKLREKNQDATENLRQLQQISEQ